MPRMELDLTNQVRNLGLKALLVLVIGLVPSLGQASFNVQPFVRSIDNVRQIDLEALGYYHSILVLRNPQVTDFIPTHMDASDSEVEVATRILSHSAHKWAQASDQKVLRAVATGDLVTTQFSSSSSSTESESHRLSMNLKADRKIASVSYRGYMNAKISYGVESHNFRVEVAKNLDKRTQLIFDHNKSSVDTSDTLGLRWVW